MILIDNPLGRGFKWLPRSGLVQQEVNDHGQTLIVDRLDITDISIKHFQIVVVTTMYNPISYPEKDKHLNILQSASEAITHKINTCTIEEATIQVNKAYMAFGVN